MPATGNPNLRRAVIPPSMVTAIRYIRDRKAELERLNGDRSPEQVQLTDGHLVGLTEAEAMILEAICDEAGNPMSSI